MPDGSALNLNIVPFPALLGDEPVAYADSHSLVVPRADRSSERAGYAADFIQGILGQSLTWAQGGHIPAWQPTVTSAAFEQLSPQKNYVQAAANAVYDPDGWYTGAGSDFQNTVGGIIIAALAGQTDPKGATAQMRSALTKLANTNAPVS